MSLREIPAMRLFFSPEDIAQIKSDVGKILKSGMLTLGEYTKCFESNFAKFCRVKHAVAVNSGTSALEIALRTQGLKSGDEVLVPTNTFSATAAAVYFAGAKPVLTDINSDTLCIDMENVQEHITPHTKGVIVVHIGGLICPDINAIQETCKDHHLFLIEDAAHAHGSTLDDQAAGSLGDAGCFSFYPTKVITTGEGGMITTDNDEVAKMARILRDQGKENFHTNSIVDLGYNWRLPEINAAIGVIQLQRLHKIVERRNLIAHRYDENISRLDAIKSRRTPLNLVNNYYKYVAFLNSDIEREELKQKLKEKGVRCGGEVYWPPLHLQPIYRKLLNTKEGSFPRAEDVCKRMICLPIYTQMNIEEVEYVAEKLEETLSEI